MRSTSLVQQPQPVHPPVSARRHEDSDRLALVALTASLVLHGVACVQLVANFSRFALPEVWLGQSLFLIGLSTVCVVVGYFVRHRVAQFIALTSLRGLFVIIMSYPLGDYATIEVTLLTSIAVDCGALVRPSVSVPLSLVLISLAVSARRSVMVWGHLTHGIGLDQLLYLILYPVIVLGLACLVWHFAALAKARQGIVERLRSTGSHLVDTNLKLQEFVALKEEQVVLLERKRLSREIHDTIGHTLMSIILMVKAIAGLVPADSKKVKELLAHTEEQAHEGMNETRRALSILRNQEMPKPPLLSRVDRLIRAFDGTHLDIRVDYGNSLPGYGERVDSIVFRFVQEGITNAIRHGDASRILISFWRQNGSANVSILDNGSGADVLETGIGLRGMQERLSEVGGGMAVGNASSGFRLTATWPAEGAHADGTN